MHDEPGVSLLFVKGIDAVVRRIVWIWSEHVPDVMQKGSGYERVGRAIHFGEVRGLERVLALGDRLAQVSSRSARLE
jgi:hypothetical protein